MSAKAAFDAGMYDRRVILRNCTEQINDNGIVDRVCVEVGPVWAHVKPLSGREKVLANQTFAEATFKVYIRWHPGITETFVVEFEGVEYNVIHIAEYGRRDGLELLVKKP